jgi:hypothetical protein
MPVIVIVISASPLVPGLPTQASLISLEHFSDIHLTDT